MGAPAFQYRAFFKQNGVGVFSSNYPLYGDMSSRVMSILEQYTPNVEIYSIDEAFLQFKGFDLFNLETEGPAEADLTGTEILADFPIIVFGGHECANVPLGFNFCDHIEQQMFPVPSWGAQYIGSHFVDRASTIQPVDTRPATRAVAASRAVSAARFCASHHSSYSSLRVDRASLPF